MVTIKDEFESRRKQAEEDPNEGKGKSEKMDEEGTNV